MDRSCDRDCCLRTISVAEEGHRNQLKANIKTPKLTLYVPDHQSQILAKTYGPDSRAKQFCCSATWPDSNYEVFTLSTMRVILMPVGPPGSGKSTLCNGLKQVCADRSLEVCIRW